MRSSGTDREKIASRKIRVLVAVEPLPLLRVIEHLLAGAPEIQIISSPHGVPTLVLQTKRLQPDLIIANARLLGEGACEVLINIKRSSPRSKLILTDFDSGLAGLADDCGVDVYLDEEALVRRLVLAARKLAAPRRSSRKLKGRMQTSYRIRSGRPA